MSDPYVKPTEAAVEPRALSPAEQEKLDLLYAELEPEAKNAARAYIMSRTPADLQEAMAAKIAVDYPPPVEA